jgi:hypothetical protein
MCTERGLHVQKELQISFRFSRLIVCYDLIYGQDTFLMAVSRFAGNTIGVTMCYCEFLQRDVNFQLFLYVEVFLFIVQSYVSQNYLPRNPSDHQNY